RLERAAAPDRDELRLRRVRVDELNAGRRIHQDRARWHDLLLHVFPDRELVAGAFDLTRIEKQDHAHGPGNRERLLDVEQQTLVAAQDEARDRVRRPDAADVEPADRILAAQEQLRENRQRLRALELVDVLEVAVQTERHARILTPEVHALDRRLVVADVAPEARKIEGQRQTPARRREDRIVDRVVNDAWRDLADDALAALSDEQRVLQERVPAQYRRVGVHRVDVGHAHALVAVVGEEPREAAPDRDAEGDRASGRRLRELVE